MLNLIYQNTNINNKLYQKNKNSLTIDSFYSIYLKKDIFQPSFKAKYYPVNNLKDAEKFAINHLKIKKFNVDDLSVANWINSALQHNKNITKGYSTCLDEVIYTDFNKFNCSNTTAAMMQTSGRYSFFSTTGYNLKHKLLVNKQYIKNLDSSIKFYKHELLQSQLLKYDHNKLKLNNNYTTQNNNKYEHLANKNINNMPTEEKIELNIFLSTLNNYASFKESIVDKSLQKIINDKKNWAKLKQMNLPNFKSFSSTNKFRLLNDIEHNLGIKHEIKIDSKFKIINHEVGHMLHAENDFSAFSGKSTNSTTLFNNNLYTISRVSRYATTCLQEFVAETYAKLADGYQLPKAVLSLYYKFGGVKIK